MKQQLWRIGAASLAILAALSTMESSAQSDTDFSYDALGRLSSVCYLATADLITYEYDATGNRSTVSSASNACGPTYFSINDAAAVLENGVLSFTVSRTGNLSAANAISYVSADGTALQPSDYTAVSGALSFAAGESEKAVTIQSLADTLYEPAETVLVNLSNPTNGAIFSDAQGLGTINNDDATSGVNFIISDASAAEGGVINVTVTKAGPTTLTHDLDFATANGTATAGADYTTMSGTLSFSPTETTKTIAITTAQDASYEGNETIFVNLSNATNGASIADAQGIATINENDPAPSFAINNVSVSEGGNLVFTVTKSGSTTLTHAVNFATANGTAIGSDYTSTSGVLTFAPGDTTKTITVVTTENSYYEKNEVLYVNLSGATNGASIADSQGAGTINNDDPAPTFAISNVSASAGSGLSFTITKTGYTLLSHSLNYATANGTATAGTHYTAASGGLTFAWNETSKTVSVSTTSGSVPRGASKSMYLNLSSLTNGATFTDSQGLGTINGPVNHAPVANNDSKSGSYYIYDYVYVYVRNNDTDADGDTLTITSAGCVSSGCSVSVQGGGTYIKVTGTTPGNKTVSYTISDGYGGTDSASATVSSFTDPCPYC